MAVTGKKGIFFTVTAAMLLLALAIMLSMQATYQPTDRTVTETRITSMNDFAKSVQNDLQRGLYITGFRAIISMDAYASNGTFLNSSQASFREAVINGSINGQPMELMKDTTFANWTAGISTKSKELDIYTNITADSITIRQQDSWTLLIESNITINITDSLNTATWHINKTVTTTISIIGLEDPLFTLNTQGMVSRTINSTQYEGAYTSLNDTTSLKAHIDNHYYANSTGPSFLMRLEGNYASSAYGIESIVNIPELQQSGAPQYQRSMVDYKYFGNLTTTGLYKIANTYENWLILDNSSLDKYQARSLAQAIG
ncbi:hypothetical protein HYY72_03260 [Candidatus Woesearchaeota archaeon]|nr:hypothetical protein [Candidatus Woesearchaeota archaeon]